METSKQLNNNDEFFNVLYFLAKTGLFLIILPNYLLYRCQSSIVLYFLKIKERYLLGISLIFFGLFVLTMGTYFVLISGQKYTEALIFTLFPIFSLIHVFVLFWWAEKLLFVVHSGRITEENLSKNVTIEDDFVKNQRNKSEIVIGKSRIDGKKIVIPTKYRNYHSLIVGASGSGKTSLMKVLCAHPFIHGNPCLIIDPKGDTELQKELIDIFNTLNPDDSDRKIHHYRFGNPKNSIRYNPLRYGNTTNIVETIMNSFDFSEQYYMNACRDFLVASVDYLRALSETVTFEKLLLIERKEEIFLQRMNKKTKDLDDKDLAEEAKFLFNELDKIDRKLLSGLVSQLKFFTQKELKYQFNPEDSEDQIDLRDFYLGGDVLLVDLDTQNSAQAGKLIGKFLINDILRISSRIGQGKIEKREDDFVVLIDEFSSIASAKMEDVLQKCRSSRIAINLFVQNFTDFKEGKKALELANVLTAMLGNTRTKYIFNSTHPDDVDKICDMIGTKNVVKLSKNVSVNRWGDIKETGIGQTSNSKEYKVEHDLVKNLKPGDCVISSGDELVKNPDLALIWNVKKDLLYHWREDYNRRWDESYRGEIGFNFSTDSVEAI